MEGLKIVEYNPAYAKAVAEMWQKSSEGFNGENCNQTEDSVLTAHANSTDINTYLAILGDEVLGYCALTKYLKDEGALHIRLLNARFDHHGKGIGKALVKKAVERTMELGWPRLDLYTWPANTKAIPLYKKCGYFYENRQDTTHLMNFIPTVMNTEAVKSFFKDADWYDDMKRTIDMEPDGRCENGFDFYEYSWAKDGKVLRMEFERKGRGLRLIETNDYMISLSADSQELIFGRSYRAAFNVVNKTGKPLNIKIKGRDYKNIKFSMEKDINIIDNEIIKGEFYLSEIEAEFASFKTHPGITADVVVNGEKASFKLGIVPKFPARVSVICDDLERYSGEAFNMYIEIESCLDEPGVFEFELPECSDIEFSRRKYNIRLEKGQKYSIPVECRLKKPCIYLAELHVRVQLESGGEVQFKRNTGAVFRGQNLTCGGEIDDKYIIVYGTYKLALDKNYNQVEIYSRGKKKDTYIVYPRLGMPYSDEFSSMKPRNVKWYFENEKMVLCGDYISNEFMDITVKTIFKISNNGIFEHYYKVINTSDKESCCDINIKQSLHYRIEGASIPYGGSIIHETEPREEYPGYYNCDKISENWIFTARDMETESLVWPKNIKLDYNGWFMNFEHRIGKLKGGESKTTEPVYLAYSTFRNRGEARRFALGSNDCENLTVIPDFQVEINKGNPFVNKDFNIDIIENRKILYRGKILVNSQNNAFDDVNIVLADGVNKVTIPIHIKNDMERNLINIQNNFDTVSFERKAHIFCVKSMEFAEQITEENGMCIYSISNGAITIKGSPEFSTGIFSLEFMGREWLDSSFPHAGPKSWYNPWFGGIQNVPEDLIENARALPREHVYMEFIEKIDNFGNRWKGIKTGMHYTDKNYKGLEVNQYFLLLPGVPVVLCMSDLINNMDNYINNSTFTNIAFLNTGDQIENSWVRVKDYEGNINQYRAGKRNFEIYPLSSPLYGCDSLAYKIQINTDFEKCSPWVYLSTRDIAYYNRNIVSLAPGERKSMANVFYTLTNEHIPDKYLENLKNISFKQIND